MSQMKPDDSLDALRAEIRRVDDALLELVAKRQELARRIGSTKLALDLPIKEFEVEKEVIARGRARARALGFSEELAEDVAKTLIRYSCWVQEEYQGRARSHAKGTRKRVLVAGGLGLMGQWLARFFESFGHAVSLHDTRPAPADSPFPEAPDLEEAARAAEVVVLATPIGATAAVIAHVARAQTAALVFDICSLKSPLLDAIRSARDAGTRITSVHPMFGPQAQLLAGRNILLCDCGDSALTEEAAALFRGSTASLVRVPLAQHDELMGVILGLSHLASLVFAGTLAQCGRPFGELVRSGSTTFAAQAHVTEAVVRENQDLYYEIQAENAWTPRMLDLLRRTLDDYAHAIELRDRDAFKRLMEGSRAYFAR